MNGTDTYRRMTRGERKAYNHLIGVRRLNRVKDWLAEHGPCQECGSWENLEINEKYPAKVVSSMIHRWRRELKDPILARAVVRCRPCRVKLVREQRVYCRHGHDLRLVGVAEDGYCKVCEEESYQRYYANRKARALEARKS